MITQQERLTQLDGLRGLAALLVFAFHVGLVMPSSLQPEILAALGRNASAAVGMFFALSGFVLALSLMRGHQPYSTFLVRRVFRLYPAYWFMLTFCGALWLLFPQWSVTATTAISAHPPGLDQWLRHAILVAPGINTGSINGVIWSLIVEMRVSLIFPLLTAAYVWMPTYGRAAVVFLSLGAAFLGPAFDSLPIFLLGIAMADLYLRGWLKRRHTIAILVLGLFLYENSEIVSLGSFVATRYVAASGSAIIIVAALNPGAFQVLLKSRVVQFFGQVSYSFYLLHLPIIVLVAGIVRPIVDSVAIGILASFAITTGLSFAAYRLIELRAIAYSRGLTSRAQVSRHY